MLTGDRRRGTGYSTLVSRLRSPVYFSCSPAYPKLRLISRQKGAESLPKIYYSGSTNNLISELARKSPFDMPCRATQGDFRLIYRILSSFEQSEKRIEGCDRENFELRLIIFW